MKVNAQALGMHAWFQFDVDSSHFAQAFGPGTVHEPANTPTDLTGLGYAAFWIAGRSTLYATNGSESDPGSYVIVEVTGHGSNASRLSVAEKLATATIASAPRDSGQGSS